MNTNFFKEFYPDYLNHTNTEIKDDKALFYFDSLRTIERYKIFLLLINSCF